MADTRSPATVRTPYPRLYIGWLGLLLWAPIPFGSRYEWARLVFEGWAFLLGIIWLAVVLRAGELRVPEAARRSWLPLLCLLLLCGWMFLQATPLPADWVTALSPRSVEIWSWVVADGAAISISTDPWHTLQDARTTLALLIFFWLAFVLIEGETRLRQTALAVVVCGALQALYGSLMTLSGAEYSFFLKKDFHIGSASGTFTSRNSFACFLYLATSVGIGLLIADSKRGGMGANWRARLRNVATLLLSPKARVRILLVVMVIAIVLSRSRMGNTALFVSMTVAGLIALYLQRKYVTRGIIILFVSLVIIDVLVVGIWFGIDKVKDRLEHTSMAAETRDEVNRDTWRMIQDHMWVGTGAGTYYSNFPAYQGQDIPGYERDAHNDYLQIWSETGVVGLALFATLVLSCLWNALRAQALRRNALMRGMGFACTMAVFALMMHSTVDFSLQMPANALLILLILAMGCLANHLPSSRGRSKRGGQRTRIEQEPLFPPSAPTDRPEPGIVG